MNLTVHLTAEIEARLKARAAESGKTLEALGLEAIEDKLSDNGESPTLLPYEIWKQGFEQLLASMPRGNPGADFSRESVY